MEDCPTLHLVDSLARKKSEVFCREAEEHSEIETRLSSFIFLLV